MDEDEYIALVGRRLASNLNAILHIDTAGDDSCFACLAPYHESTGHLFREWGIVYCGPCTRHVCAFVKGMMSRKVGRSRAGFYEAASTSVRAGVYPGEGVERWEPASNAFMRAEE